MHISNYSTLFLSIFPFFFFTQNYHQYSQSVLRIHYREKLDNFYFSYKEFKEFKRKKIRKNSQFAKAIIYKIPRHSFLNCEERLSRTAYWLNNGRRKPIYFLSSESSAMGKGGIRFLNWDALCFQGNYDTL